MIKLLIFSFKKSKLLSKIATESQSKPLTSKQFFDQALQSITQPKTPDKRELYVEQLLTLLGTDKETRNLLEAHRKTFDDVRKIIKTLEVNGAGQIIKGHYVAVSSVAFLKQLQPILQYWDGENFKINDLDIHNSNLKMAFQLIESFN